MKALKIPFAVLFLFIVISVSAQEKKSEEKGHVFTTVIENKITSIKNQNRSGTCWDYATCGFFEGEILRATGKTVDLSEMFVASKDYIDCATYNIRLHGDSRFSQGGSCDDVLDVIRNYGICPESAMAKPGSMVGDTLANFNEFFMVLEPYVKAIARSNAKKLSPAWHIGFQNILDAYLGKCPEKFIYEGKEYTPKTFATSLKLNFDDYISITSFTHHPFYKNFIIEAPYKWRPRISYNVPLKEMMEIIDNALKDGYNVAWGGDVSGNGFQRTGIAEAPKEKITQESRQQRFDNWDATYDHVMLIYGIAKDENGVEYYKVKNSWGNAGDYNGIWYMAKDYIADNTTYIFLNKNAIKSNGNKSLATND
jgi:aminopeptidase C